MNLLDMSALANYIEVVGNTTNAFCSKFELFHLYVGRFHTSSPTAILYE